MDKDGVYQKRKKAAIKKKFNSLFFWYIYKINMIWNNFDNTLNFKMVEKFISKKYFCNNFLFLVKIKYFWKYKKFKSTNNI